MRFLVLGPIEASVDGREVDLGTGRPRALLALLLLHAGEVVSSDRLIDELWNGRPPPTAAKVVQGYVSQLRRVLPEDTIATRGSGYLLHADDTDAAEFEHTLAVSRDEDPRAASRSLRHALSLWRGRPYSDVEYEPWAQAEIARLEELRLVALEERIDADLELGDASRVVPELEALVAEHPLRERLRALLMLALYRSGRQAAALDAYADARSRLVEELGIEPGPELQDMQRRILAQDPELGAAPRRFARAARRGPWLVAAGGALLAAVAIAAGFLLTGGSAGVRANSLVLVDGATGSLDADIGVGSRPSQVTAGAGAVWVLNSDDNTISEIDPASRRAVATFATGSRTVGIAASADALWLANAETTASTQEGTSLPRSLTKVDAATRSPLFTVTLPAKYDLAYYSRFPGQRVMVVGAGSVWVVARDYHLLRLAETTGKLEKRFPFGADSLVFGGGELWLMQQGQQVMRLDPATNRIDLTFPLSAGPGIDYGFGSAWVSDPVQGLVWRITPGTPPRARSIPVASVSTAVAVSARSVWLTSILADEVTRVDPRTNRADLRIALTAPQDAVATDRGVWITTGAPPPSSGPLPLTSCGPLVYPGPGRPRFIVASDLALQGNAASSTVPIQRGIEALIRARGFRAGKYTIGYQSCDDSTVQSAAFDWAKCITNARAYGADLDVIGVVGTYNSGCSFVEIPILNAARNGPLAMVSPLNTNAALTIHSSAAAPVRMDPTGSRSFARVIAADQIQFSADAELEHELGVTRVAVVDDGGGSAVEADRWFTYAARRLGLKTVTVGWDPNHPDPAKVLRAVRQTRADGVFFAAGGLPAGGRIVAALHAGLGRKVPIVVTDWFAGWPLFVHIAGPSIDGVYASTGGIPDSSLPADGRRFVRRLGARYSFTTAYGGAATQVLLDAIARSNGTRASVAAELFKTRIQSFVGPLAIDSQGDPATAGVTIFRIERGAHNETGQHDFQDAVVDRVIYPAPRIIPR